jgi:hypothetical protein
MFRTIILLVIVGFVAVVFWRGWLEFSVTNKGGQNETDATLTINKNKIKQDLEYLKNREHSVAKESKDIAETTDHGRVQTLGKDQLSLLTAEGQTLKVGIAPDTDVRIGGKAATMSDLHIGDPVTVVHVTRDNGLRAISITVGDRKN